MIFIRWESLAHIEEMLGFEVIQFLRDHEKDWRDHKTFVRIFVTICKFAW